MVDGPGSSAGGRDQFRTPMQWSNNPNAGFSDGTPWIAVNNDYSEVNVEVLEQIENR